MRLSIDQMEHWEFGALGIHNPGQSTLAPYFELVKETENIPGDVLELGVLRVASLITTGLLLESMNSARKVLGLDTFAGFPGFSEEDELSQFDRLAEKSLISQNHLDKVKRNKSLVRIRGSSLTPGAISNSANFSDTSFNLVEEKIRNLGLDKRVNVKQVDISVELQTVVHANFLSLVLMDVDLYLPYAKALPVLFELLSIGGFIYLDEYYSLKFPGPRLAVNRFIESTQGAKLERLEDWLDFERWAIRKVVPNE